MNASPSAMTIPPAPPTTTFVDDLRFNIRSVNAEYSVYWHSVLVQSTVVLIGGAAGVFSLGVAADVTGQLFKFGMPALSLLLLMLGVGLHRAITGYLVLHREILQKVDNDQELFPGQTYPYYPEAWRPANAGVDPVGRICKFAYASALLVWLASTVLVGIDQGWYVS